MTLDSQNSLRSLVTWTDEVLIVPHSGIQMLDFGFSIETVEFSRRFLEKTVGETEAEVERMLVPLSGRRAETQEVEQAAGPDAKTYTIDARAALEPFLSKWVPVPVLRVKKEPGPNGEERYDPGPSTWARLRIVELQEADAETGHTHRVQLALDTALAASEQDRYLMPDRADVRNPREFRFVSDPEHMDWFLRLPETQEDGEVADFQKWVSDWIKELYFDFLRAIDPDKPVVESKLKRAFEHWARYITMLGVVSHAVRVPKLRFAATLAERDAVAPVDVDLVLDVGNSRTCGILIERFPDDGQVDLSNSYPLGVRDLSQPELYYSGLVESRVEFADASFGNDRFASRSGRRNAFLWPSLVRIGPEASRLVEGEKGTETKSGLSSPKRYLWDNALMPQDWRFHGHRDPTNLPRSARAAMQHLNETGEVIAQVRDEVARRLRDPKAASTARSIRPRFSRSSLFSFMLSEIFAHALVQVNDAALRSRQKQSNLPRRLSRIILTLPTATPMQEQSLIRSHAAAALRLVWQQFGIEGTDTVLSSPPELIVEWDEASCTQLVYLYSEITQKFEGRIGTYLKLMGQDRQRDTGGAREPSLRLACIDVGGGTTDLVVTTYFARADVVLEPEHRFREGFRVAGDDLIQRLIAQIILPAMADDIEAAGGAGVMKWLKELFGGDFGGMDQQTARRRQQFAMRVLVPLAVALLEASEAHEDMPVNVALAQVLGTELDPAADIPDDSDDEDAARLAAEAPRRLCLADDLVSYVEKPASGLGARDWRLRDLSVACESGEIAAVVRETFSQALSNMGEVIAHFDCDAVLLTGRPSRHPALRRIVEEMLVIPPDRLVSMHAYRADLWYPFRDRVTHRIGDPKSTVAVGGMLIALAGGRIPNFRVTTEAYLMRSTARYIGKMEITGQIRDDQIYFSDLDLDRRKGGRPKPADVEMNAPIHIGSRQVPLERWTTTPLYRLDFASASAHRLPPPLRVRIERVDAEEDDLEGTEGKLRFEALREAFEVTAVRNGHGEEEAEEIVALKLHTMGFADEYWLDTGIFRI